MEKSSFFNSRDGDRKYRAEDWADYFSSFISNGVMPLPSSGLQVAEMEDMTVKLRPGKAWINGYFYHNTEDLNLQLQIADGTLNRIDRVVIRWDSTNREIRAIVKTGAPSQTPARATIQRDVDIWELAVADIAVNKGVTKITQANITDQRLNGNLCGVSAGIIKQIDTTDFNAQLQAWFRDYKKMSAEEYAELVTYFNTLKVHSDEEYRVFLEYLSNYKEEYTNEFNNWFDSIKSVLDENAVANLTNMVNALKDRVTLVEDVLFNDVTENPFLIAFDDLDGIESTGVWNAELQRIEC